MTAKHSEHLARLLDALVGFVRDYVVLTTSQSYAVALWIAHTHALDAFESTPFLAVTSPEKRCGKTRLLDVLELVVARAWRVIMPSEAVLFRKIEAVQPTLMLDETDAVFDKRNGNTEPLRALLNAGNRRGTSVPRCVGPTQQLVDFNTFCPKALVGIGELPDTIFDRSIPIRMIRKRRDEAAQRFRRRDALEIAEPLHQGLASWAQDALADLEAARPSVPAELDDRAEEAWEPLFAIAALAGGDWPERVHLAALQLSTGTDDEALGVWLLRDIRNVFAAVGTDRISSADLAASLCEIEESPWGDLDGKALDARGLARRLKPFAVRPRSVRFDDGRTPKGYVLEQFEDAFARYLADLSATPPQPAPLSGKQAESEPPQAGSETSLKPAPVNGCGGVAAKSATQREDAVPLPGDEDFGDFLLHAVQAGHITEAEASERYTVHKLIRRSRAA